MAGYSGTPLIRKLGLKPQMRALFVREPAGYRETLGELPDGVAERQRLTGELDFIHVFCRDRRQLDEVLPRAKGALARNGLLWVSWPKKASGVATDLDENVVRSRGLRSGLVDVKVCAVDEVWSGLKFVYRVQDR